MKADPYVPWFLVGESVEDDPAALAALDAPVRTFVTVLRQRAVTWPCGPDDTFVLLPADTGFAHPAALLAPPEPGGSNSISAVFGAFFDGQGVLGTEVHNQLHVPTVEDSVVEVLRAAGSPARCAERAADWFERVLGGRVGNWPPRQVRSR